jgi:hypothetical protein
MKQPEVMYKIHSLRFPFAQVIFGKVFQMPCEMLFDFAENEEGGLRLKVLSLTGMSEDGTEYDLMYLTEDDDSMYSQFIVAAVISNQQYWDYESEGDEEWWEQSRLGKKQ